MTGDPIEVGKKPLNVFHQFLKSVVPLMQENAKKYEEISRIVGKAAIHEFRLISWTAGRQTGKTTGLYNYLNEQAVGISGPLALVFNSEHEGIKFYGTVAPEKMALIGPQLTATNPPRKIVDIFLLSGCPLLVLSGEPRYINPILEEVERRYTAQKHAFNPKFVIIKDN